MWYFDSPHIVYGEDALSHLETLGGTRAFIVTDSNVLRLGFVDLVRRPLEKAGFAVAAFAEVEPDPSVQTVLRGVEAMRAFAPDWIIGLGGGSSMDAAKAMWVLYERPDISPESINPLETYNLRQKARLVTIPTTSGTGSEATWGIVLSDTVEQRKMALGNRECLADFAIVDPIFVGKLPASITSDTGMDALAHAFDAYVNTWHNDYSDGPALQAIRLVFDYLPRAYADGADAEAREHMHNAAAIAGLAFSNSLCCLSHGMGHALGAYFHLPHGRCVGLCTPYTLEFFAPAGVARLTDLAYWLHLPAETEEQAAGALAGRIRALARQIGQPTSLAEAGVSRPDFDAHLERLMDHAEADSQTLTSPRLPDRDELGKLFEYVYEGKPVDF
jgi:alcohol dehydrogenase class IV